MEYNDLPLARREQIEAARKKVKEKNLLGCLLVENVGVMTQAEVEVRKLTLFIGENNTGKSTLAKLLKICMNIAVYTFSRDEFIEVLKNYDIEGFINVKSSIIWVSALIDGVIYFEYDALYVSYRYNALDRKKINEMKQKLNLTHNDMFEDEAGKLVDYLKGYKVKNKIPVEQEFPNFNVLYIPAERELVSTISGAIFSFVALGLPISKSILYFAMEFERIKAERKSIDIDFLNVSYEWSNNSHQIRIDEQTTVPINVASSGVKAVTPAYVTLSSYRQRSDSFVIIEEPENNLHPLSQKAFLNKLSEFCLQGDLQFLVVTTHSPYVLSSFNNQIQAGTLAANKPDLVDKIEKIIPRSSWLNFANVSAYELKTGSAYSILDEEWQGVMTETIDQASDMMGDEYDRLLDLKYQDGDNE